ncbi:MAG: hypothetical protein V1861_02190 [Candidatus Micrarchaeota archaeon]
MPSESEQVLREILGPGYDELNETTRAIILGTPAETIRKSHAKLLELGLTREKIATNAPLLGRDPETIQRNYEFLRRFFSKEAICKNAQLLGNTQETIEGSVQFLFGLGVDYAAFPFVDTTAFCKQKKLAVVAREKYGASDNMTSEERTELAAKSRDFVRKKPKMLRMGEKTIVKKFAKAA